MSIISQSQVFCATLWQNIYKFKISIKSVIISSTYPQGLKASSSIQNFESSSPTRLGPSPPKEIPFPFSLTFSRASPSTRSPHLRVLFSLSLYLPLYLPYLPRSLLSLHRNITHPHPHPRTHCRTHSGPHPTPSPSIRHQCFHYHRQIHQPKHQHPRDSHPRTQNRCWA